MWDGSADVAVAGAGFAVGFGEVFDLAIGVVVADELLAHGSRVVREGRSVGTWGSGGFEEKVAAGLGEEFEGPPEAGVVVFEGGDFDADVEGYLEVGAGADGAVGGGEGDAVGVGRGLGAVALEEDDGEAGFVEAGEEVAGSGDPGEGLGDVFDCLAGGSGAPGGADLLVLGDADDGEGDGMAVAFCAGDVACEGIDELLAVGEVGFGVDEVAVRVGVLGLDGGGGEGLEAAVDERGEPGGGGDEEGTDGSGELERDDEFAGEEQEAEGDGAASGGCDAEGLAGRSGKARANPVAPETFHGGLSLAGYGKWLSVGLSAVNRPVAVDTGRRRGTGW